jgi:hypothetical protein
MELVEWHNDLWFFYMKRLMPCPLPGADMRTGRVKSNFKSFVKGKGGVYRVQCTTAKCELSAVDGENIFRAHIGK